MSNDGRINPKEVEAMKSLMKKIDPNGVHIPKVDEAISLIKEITKNTGSSDIDLDKVVEKLRKAEESKQEEVKPRIPTKDDIFGYKRIKECQGRIKKAYFDIDNLKADTIYEIGKINARKNKDAEDLKDLQKQYPYKYDASVRALINDRLFDLHKKMNVVNRELSDVDIERSKFDLLSEEKAILIKGINELHEIIEVFEHE